MQLNYDEVEKRYHVIKRKLHYCFLADVCFINDKSSVFHNGKLQLQTSNI